MLTGVAVAGGFVLDAADWIHQKTLRVVKTVQYTKELPR